MSKQYFLLAWATAFGFAAVACNRYDDDPALRDVSNQPVNLTGSEVAVMGRHIVDANQRLVLSWSGSAISTRFSGPSVIANIELVNGQKTNYMQVVLDGNDAAIQLISADTTQYTIQATGDGPHTLMLVKLNEPMDGTWLFGGFSPGDGGTLLPTQVPTGRRIEFIGDSITCGYGNLGTITTDMLTSSQNDTINSLRSCQTFLGKKVFEVSSGYQAFSAKTARNLQAEWHLTSWSGKGVYRNADGTQNETIPQIWQRSVAADGNTAEDLNAWVPQVVFVDLGTNDFGSIADSTKEGGGIPDLEQFRNNYLGMLKEVRRAWPNAWIFLAVGPMLSDYYPKSFPALSTARTQIKTIIKTFGDKRVRFLEFPLNIASNDDPTGCEWHPNVVQDEKMAKQVTLAIQDALNWQ